MTAPHDLAALLDGAPWRRLALVGDSRALSWTDRVTDPLGEVVADLDVLREQQLAEALRFAPDLAIVALGRPLRAELEETVRRLRRAGADVLMVERDGDPLAAAMRSVAMQHGALLVRVGETADDDSVAIEAVRCLAASLGSRVVAA
jgi:cation transport ATPase